MGCSNSKLLDDGALPKSTLDKPTSTKTRQARLSLAGHYCQIDLIKSSAAQPSLDKTAGLLSRPSLTPNGPSLQIQYAIVSQRGYYPDQPNKSNQDAVVVLEKIDGREDTQFFGVFDGHGETGTECAQFAAQQIPENLGIAMQTNEPTDAALRHATIITNNQLHASPIEDILSGTTACMGVLKDHKLYVANVGDSRAVLAVRDTITGTLMARDLTEDQTPFREDECERVIKAGARVLTLDQVEGLKDIQEQCWTSKEEDCDGDPPRLWAADGTYPGTAFTRSIGDKAAETIGVVADPETTTVPIDSTSEFVIFASDGVWEFITSQRAVDIVSQFTNPQDAANALIAASYKAWLQRETRTDDITVVLVYFKFERPDVEVALAS